MKKTVLPLAIIVFSIIIMYVLGGLKKDSPRMKRPPAIRSLEAVRADFREYVPEINQLGRIQASQRVRLTSEVTGRILDTGFRLRKGYDFSRNQILAVIDNQQAENSFRLSVSELLSSVGEMLPNMKIDISDAYPKWERFFDELGFQKLPPLPEIESGREKMFVTRYKVFSAYYSAANQYERLQNHYIRAPFSGEVSEAGVEPGDIASPSISIATLVNNREFEIELSVQRGEFNYISSGAEVRIVSTQGGEIFSGRVIRKLQDIKNQTREVVISLFSKGDGVIADGTYAEVYIPADTIDSFRLSRSAVYKKDKVLIVENVEQRERGKKGVMAGELDIVPVEISFFDADYAYITGGLEQGETVIRTQVEDPVKGMLIQPVLKGSE